MDIPPPQRFRRALAAALGLVTVRDLAQAHAVEPATMRSWLRRAAAPAPKGVTDEFRRGVREPLYQRTEVDAFLAGSGAPTRIRRRSAPPRRVGLRAPTAGRPYVWRDPARWSS